jgi:hypothetical protein
MHYRYADKHGRIEFYERQDEYQPVAVLNCWLISMRRQCTFRLKGDGLKLSPEFAIVDDATNATFKNFVDNLI